ncbi:MAG: LEA type 2 family protein [Deltaproteobacteria bacterium]|nr:LEA type 2 family protein [Deltaproteobacteria bacterium]
MKRAFTLFVVLKLMVFSGCELLQKEFMGRYGIKNCTFELMSVNAEVYPNYSNLDKSYAILLMRVRVDNPNSYKVILDRMLFDLLINDRTVLRDLENNSKREVDPGASTTFEISVKVTYDEVESAAKGLFEGIQSGTVSYKLDATVFFDSEITSFSYRTTIKEGEI